VKNLLIIPALLLFIHIILALVLSHFYSSPHDEDFGFVAIGFLMLDTPIVLTLLVYLPVSAIYSVIQTHRNRQADLLTSMLLGPLSLFLAFASIGINILTRTSLNWNPIFSTADIMLRSSWWWGSKIF
jgi:hypothetical protein